MIHENPDDGEQACDLLMVAKYLERIGDHATNISEWVLLNNRRTYRLMIESWTKRGDFYEVGMYEDK